MPAPDYVFTMTLERGRPFDRMIGEVATVVFRDLGCAPGTVEAAVRALDAAIGPSLDGETSVDLRFTSAGGTCDVLIVAGNREIWRTSLRP